MEDNMSLTQPYVSLKWQIRINTPTVCVQTSFLNQFYFISIYDLLRNLKVKRWDDWSVDAIDALLDKLSAVLDPYEDLSKIEFGLQVLSR